MGFTLRFIGEHRVISIIRLDRSDHAIEAAIAVAEGGIRLVEITLTTPEALEIIESLSHREDMLVGVGTVLQPDQAAEAIAAGAQFVVCPHTDAAIIERCKQDGAVVITCGATPNEVLNAWRLGADIVKVFPASSFGGPSHVRLLRGPMPFLRLMPTGGVRCAQATEYLQAGAYAVGIGSDLVDPGLVAAEQFDRITEHARTLVRSLGPQRVAL